MVGVMRLRRRRYGTIVKHAKHYRSRLNRVPRETLRGVVRGNVGRFRNFVPSSAKRTLGRRIERLIAVYETRFGHDAFAQDIKNKVVIPMPRSNWLPGGFAHWRSRINQS